MYAVAYLERSITSTVGILVKITKEFYCNVRLGSKYASGINFIVEKVNRMSLFV